MCESALKDYLNKGNFDLYSVLHFSPKRSLVQF